MLQLKQRFLNLVVGSFKKNKSGKSSRVKWVIAGKVAIVLAPIAGYVIMGIAAAAVIVSVFSMLMSPIDSALAFITGSKEDTSIEKLDDKNLLDIKPEDFGISPENLDKCISGTGADVRAMGTTVESLGTGIDPEFAVDYATYAASFVAPAPSPEPQQEPPATAENAPDLQTEPQPAPDTIPMQDTIIDPEFNQPPPESLFTPQPEEETTPPPTSEPLDPAVEKVSPEEFAKYWKKSSTHGIQFIDTIRPDIPPETLQLLHMLAQRTVATSGNYPDYKAPDPYQIAKICGQEFGKSQLPRPQRGRGLLNLP